MRTFPEWLRDNGLSVTFTLLFVVCIVLQSLTGLSSYNDTMTIHDRPTIGYVAYLGSGDFLTGVLSNWQAAVLQLGALIVFGKFLFQRGASHSRKPEGDKTGDRDREERSRAPWIYRNSLSVAFCLMFALSFAGHVVAGAWAFNESRSLDGQLPVSIASSVLTSEFWFKTTQTWQAEFFAIAAFLVLSIYLRQQGSPESKPVEDSDDETGEANK